MSRDRLFGRGGGRAASGGGRPARDGDVPVDVARSLSVRATRLAIGPRLVETLYLRWLRATAAARPHAAMELAVPGRQTQMLRHGCSDRRERRAHGPRAPGRWTRVLHEASDDPARLPG